MRKLTVLIGLSLLAAPAWSDGKALFSQNCVGCHGATGKGDGPDGAYYDIPPSNLTAATYKRGTDDVTVLREIQNGIPGTPMPAAGIKLSAADCKALMEYLKTLRH
jgi:high-affinity iron transporter